MLPDDVDVRLVLDVRAAASATSVVEAVRPSVVCGHGAKGPGGQECGYFGSTADVAFSTALSAWARPSCASASVS
jgi:hypothetical protein